MDAKETSINPALFRSSSSVVADDDPTLLRIGRSSSVGASMASFMQNLHHQQQDQQRHIYQQNSRLQNPPCPPPVAMSLRARETASMALKDIFDREMMNNGGFLKEEEGKATQGQHIGGFQGMRNQSMPDLRNRVPELDLSFWKTQETNSAYAQTGFGSPISTPTPTEQTLLSHCPQHTTSQLVQRNSLPLAAASARVNASSRQPTAPLTIFYSGTVSVYDDVPVDKANAIMLLAGNSWSSNFKNTARPATPPSQTESMVVKERAASPVKVATSQQQTPTSPATITNTAGPRNIPSPTCTVSTASMVIASPPSPAPVPLSDGINTKQVGVPGRRAHAGIELPHARKASLARFLEKRKDRVQVNPDQEEVGVGEKRGKEGEESTSYSGKPDHQPLDSSSGKKQRTCSRSPSPSMSSADKPSATNKTENVDECSSQKGSLNEHYFFH